MHSCSSVTKKKKVSLSQRTYKPNKETERERESEREGEKDLAAE